MIPLLLAAAVFLQAAPPRMPAQSPSTPPGQAPAKSPAAQPAKTAEAYFQFMLGRSYEADGEVDLAVKAFRAAAAADPAAAEIRAELAALFARQNNAREAIVEAEAALKLDAGNREAHKVLGLVYSALARPEAESSRGDAERTKYATEAISHFESVSGGSPATLEPGIQLTLARLYLQTGVPAKSIPLLTGLIEDVPDAPELLPLLADAFAGAGRLEEATKVLEDGAAKRPSLLAPLASLYERQGLWSDAARVYQKAVAAFPRNADLRTRLAFALLNDGGRSNPARAREVLEAALKDSPTDGRLLYLLAQAQRLMKDFDAAEATARTFIKHQPGNLWGVSALAEVLSERREYRKIVEELAPLVAAAPQGEDATRGREFRGVLTELGLAYQQLGDHDKAIDIFDRLGPLFGQDATGEIYRAQARLAARRFDEAISMARAARKRFPADPRPARIEADALRESGRIDEGVALLESEVKARPDDLVARMALAELLLNGQLLERAEALLRETVAKFPERGDAPVPARGRTGAPEAPRRGGADLPRGTRQGSGQRPGPELPRVHAGRPWPETRRGRFLDSAGPRKRSPQRLVSGQPRVGLLPAEEVRRSRTPASACSRATTAQLHHPGSLR